MKPSYASFTSWMALLSTVVGGLLASGLLADGSLVFRILGAAQMVLSGLGYQTVKTAAHLGAAKAKAVASLGPQPPRT